MTGRQPRRPTSNAFRKFYEAVLDDAERADFEAALDIEGLDGEVALLRMLLRDSAQAEQRNPDFFLKATGVLVRALAARYKLTPEEQEGIEDAVRRLLREIESDVAEASP